MGGVLTSCGVRGGCCYNEDVASLKMLLRCKHRCCLQKGGWGGVMMSCGVRGGCCYNEDVASLKMLLRCKYRCCVQKGWCDDVMWRAWRMLLQ